MHGNEIAQTPHSSRSRILGVYEMRNSRRVHALKTNVCEMCGAVYEMYKHNVFGGIAGVRTKYCSDECAHKAKVEREKNYKRGKRNQEGRQKPGPKPKPKTRFTPNIYRVGPLETTTCFGCPFLGWQCRSMRHPICRPHNKLHHEYKRVVREMEDRYYLW